MLAAFQKKIFTKYFRKNLGLVINAKPFKLLDERTLDNIFHKNSTEKQHPVPVIGILANHWNFLIDFMMSVFDFLLVST